MKKLTYLSIAILLLSLLTIAISEEMEKVIDAFNYSDSRKSCPCGTTFSVAAQSVWTPGEDTPPVEAALQNGKRGLRIVAPFSRGLERTIHDREISLDLSCYGYFTLQVCVENPDAFNAFTLYFRSGEGWYGGSGALSREGWQTLVFDRAAFQPEGDPIGWHRITGIRLSAWALAPIASALVVSQLTARSHDIVIVLPTRASGVSDGDIATARRNAELLTKMLEEIGAPADTLEDRNLSTGLLANRRLVILPLNPRLPPKAADALRRFVGRGGKLFVAYALADGVGELLGVRRTGWMRQERPNQFALIQLNAPEVEGLPELVRQASWNITLAEPSSERTQVIGYWSDADGNATRHPALFLGENGAFLSHIILPDDWHAKQQLLAAIFGRLIPDFQKRIAEKAINRIGRIGHLTTIEAASAFVKQAGRAESLQLLEQAGRLQQQAESHYSQGAFFKAAADANAARTLFSQAYLLSHASPATEGRAVWNHSGTGAYPGDWERSARELAAAGFNMVIPNMLWAGLAHYPSQFLPHSEIFRTYGDQVAQCVEAARRHGLEVHVWKVNWNLQGAPQSFVKEMRAAGRTQVSRNGTPIDWLCPSHPENVQLELDSLLEVVEKYDVDGIHFDYIRYPGPEACYCNGCRERFTLATRKRIANWPKDVLAKGRLRDAYLDWRAEQITRLVRLTHDRARALKPNIKISAAVFGSYPSCVAQIGQDWVAWAKAGYVDFLCPMNYTDDNYQFARLVKRQMELIPVQFPLYPGVGATAARSALMPDQVVGQIYLSREAGASGFAIFDYSVSLADSVVPAVGVSVAATTAKPAHRANDKNSGSQKAVIADAP